MDVADQQHLKLDEDGLEVHLLVDRGAHISTTSSSSSGIDMRSRFSVGNFLILFGCVWITCVDGGSS
jgi:hypothetical protein